jgi:hypothetical protein
VQREAGDEPFVRKEPSSYVVRSQAPQKLPKYFYRRKNRFTQPNIISVSE